MASRLQHRHLAEIVEASHDAIITFGLDGTITSWNRAAERLYGYTAEEAIGASMLMLVPAERHDYWRWAAARIGHDIAFEQHETQRVRKDGTLLEISMTVSPMRDENGKVYGACTIARDITQQKRTVRELTMRLKQQEAVAALGSEALQMEELQPLFDHAVERLADTLAVDYVKILETRAGEDELFLRAGTGWKPGLVGRATVPANPASQAGFALTAATPVIVDDLRTETRFSNPFLLLDHGVVSGMSTLISGARNKPFGVLGVHTRERRTFTSDDINFLQSVTNVLAGAVARFQAKENQDLLLYELRHRISNLFAQILALHEQTARSTADIAELTEKFENRVHAIAAAHSALAEYESERTDLRALLEGLLVAYNERTCLDGPAIPLAAKDAFALALALNELVMNASKHGCFRSDRGALSVTWRQRTHGEESGFELEWRESCEPADVGQPHQESFGTRLIRMMVESSLGGSVSRRFEPNGLLVLMTIPLAADLTAGGELRADKGDRSPE